jgi:signal transduction histidine kinase
MNRPWQIWTAFAACAGIAFAAAGWVSLKALQAEANEAAAREKSILEENTRLALWRMDSLMAPLVAQENARPYFAYDAFYPADRAYGRMFNTLANGEVHALVPSPLLAASTPFVLVHFQVDPDGTLSSPQVPTGKADASAVRGLVDAAAVARAKRLLTALEPTIKNAVNTADLPVPQASSGLMVMLPPFQEVTPNAKGATLMMQQGRLLTEAQQFERNRSEYEARSLYVQRQNVYGNDNSNPPNQQLAFPTDGQDGLLPPHADEVPPTAHAQADHSATLASEVQVAMMKPFWDGTHLLLARRVNVGGRGYVQGCALDWPAIQSSLVASIADLLPHARLAPETSVASNALEEARDTRLLASLPVRLIPGMVPLDAATGLTPVQLALLVGWVAVAVAAGAVAMLLQGVLSLSERRAAFVSAVTHELRTPLTTFRMYSEMLAQGMVRDKADQQRYLETLRIEADRLTHLVANVLAYARLERGRPGGRVEILHVDRLLDIATERLADRAEEAGFVLDVAVPTDVGALEVRADASIVEQILFNLVDNACKYAVTADDRTLTLAASRDDAAVVVRVCDRGPGISPRGQNLLFRPFRKSASEAAVTAPGVGLGLALSRRLARDMGGDLRHEPSPTGTCFALRLPLATRS